MTSNEERKNSDYKVFVELRLHPGKTKLIVLVFLLRLLGLKCLMTSPSNAYIWGQFSRQITILLYSFIWLKRSRDNWIINSRLALIRIQINGLRHMNGWRCHQVTGTILHNWICTDSPSQLIIDSSHILFLKAVSQGWSIAIIISHSCHSDNERGPCWNVWLSDCVTVSLIWGKYEKLVDLVGCTPTHPLSFRQRAGSLLECVNLIWSQYEKLVECTPTRTHIQTPHSFTTYLYSHAHKYIRAHTLIYAHTKAQTH